MKKTILLAITVFTISTTYSQGYPHIEPETWSEKPALHSIDKKYENESAVILLDIRKIEFIDDAKGNVQSFKTLHKIIHINDDKGIEAFNKVYLPVSDNSDIIEIKARTILPGGKIIELDKSNIKDLKEDDRLYKIFALDGLQKGCEVEYYYTYNRDVSFFGREVMQVRMPVLMARLCIISPQRLGFETKTFNSIARQIDTVFNEKRQLAVNLHDLTGAEDEKYSTHTANMARIEFRLSYNAAKNKTERLFTWDELARRVYANYSSFTPRELKRTEDLIDEKKWARLGSDKEKIAAVENYIKKTIGTRRDISGDDAENIEKILRNKIASYRGIIRLFAVLYNKLAIDIQFVLTGDRSDFAIDKNFENWNNCENSLIYFSNEKKFLAPTSSSLRYPWIEPYWGNTYGLFCKGTVIGTFSTAIGEVRQVVLEDYTQSSNNIEAKVELNTSADTLLVSTRQLYRGYSASFYRAVFNFASGEEQKKYLKEFVKFGTNSENIVSTKLENQDFESYTDNKPFILDAVVKASELVEKAGSKVLVRIGDIIGPQVEMYQEKPRQFPMEIPYGHTLQRKIEFSIPDGYTVKNLNELIIKNTYEENGQTTMGFVSGYKQDGNKIMIDILEEYRKTFYPITQYEDFKKIINAAADFNKIVLVLEKK